MTFAPEALTQLRWPSMSLLTALVSAALLLLALLFAYPLLAAVIRTIDDLPAALAELGSALSSGTLQRVLGNTLIVVTGGAVIATVFGTALAYINERTDANMGLFERASSAGAAPRSQHRRRHRLGCSARSACRPDQQRYPAAARPNGFDDARGPI